MIINVYGDPAPQGSKRHVGNGRMIESSAKVRPWREAVKQAALAARNVAVTTEYAVIPPLEGPLQVDLIFTLRKPLSAPKRTTTYPSKKPDLDKLCRAVFDSLTDAGVWLDDGQVVSVVATKAFPREYPGTFDTPGVRILVKAAL